MKLICLIFGLFIAFIQNINTEQTEGIRQRVFRGERLFALLEYPSQCPVLLANDGELIKFVLATADITSLDNILLITCKDDDDVLTRIVQIAAELSELTIPARLKSTISFMKSPRNNLYKKVLFEECAIKKNYDCVKMFAKELCTITDGNGGNLLHIAAQNNDENLLKLASFCNLLIKQKDFNDKLPMEYVQSREIAQKLNEQWLEVAKERFLTLESSRIRMEMCAKFDLEIEETYSEENGNRLFLKEAFDTGIDDAEELFCPYLKMKINLLEGKGRDPSGMLLEWLSYLLNDIFSPLDSEENEEGNFKTALFTRNWDNEYIPTGKYSSDVYDFVGKIIAIAKYFGLGHNIKLSDCKGNSDDFNFYEAIQNGMDKMKFLRTEIHQIDGTYVLVLKGRNVFVQLAIDEGYGKMIKYLKNTKYVFFFREAFKSLSDTQKLKFVSLVLKDENLKDGFVKVSLSFKTKGDFCVHKWKKEIEIKKFESIDEYKNVLERMIQ